MAMLFFKLIGKHIVTDFSLIYPAAKETGKLVTFKLIEKKNRFNSIQEMYVTCKTNCIVYS